MKRFILSLMILPLLLLAAGCSVVFTGSITGELHDADAYDAGDAASGIADAAVYLYTEEEPWAEDLAAWAGGTGPLPDYPADTGGNPLDPRYFLKTVTDTDGAFTFNGFIWEELFPVYGKSGDRKEVFMLYHQRDYGLTGNDTPIYIVSNVTNRLPPVSLEKIVNTAVIDGIVEDKSSGEGIANVNVDVFVPESWDYNDSTGEMENITWSSDPSYNLVTNTEGEYSSVIEFPREPDLVTNEGTVKVRIVFNRNGYETSNTVDGNITDGGWDRNGDSTVDYNEDDPYLQTDWITNGRSETITTVDMVRTEYSTSAEGRVFDNMGTTALNGIEVLLYIDRASQPTTPEEIAAWDDRVYTQTIVLTEGEIQNGNYTFTGIEWDKSANTLETSGSQTYITCYLGIEDATAGNFTLYEENIYSDSENYFEYNQSP
ncbi:MAG: hypothetical protein JW760_02085 [Spirochaetales bacterium]|nr:hypothetical protein [Spirochaetales bacterium]